MTTFLLCLEHRTFNENKMHNVLWHNALSIALIFSALFFYSIFSLLFFPSPISFYTFIINWTLGMHLASCIFNIHSENEKIKKDSSENHCVNLDFCICSSYLFDSIWKMSNSSVSMIFIRVCCAWGIRCRIEFHISCLRNAFKFQVC